MKKVKKKIPYIDYTCNLKERVQWKNMKGEKFEGVIIEWDSNVAIVKLDNGIEKSIEC